MYRISSSSSSDETEYGSGISSTNSTKQRRKRLDLRNSTYTKEAPRREENSFSFKHFLQNDGQSNYQYTGTRPKIYAAHRTSPEPNILNSDGGSVYPRNPTELPDFVQDHLVIEQCYMNQEEPSLPVPDVDNLPDFAPVIRCNQRYARSSNRSKKVNCEVLRDLSFDFTDCLNKRHQEQPSPNLSDPGPLDLPNFDKCNEQPANSPESLRFPFDLQVPSTESNFETIHSNTEEGSLDGISANVTKSLPDFLNDGPIRNREQLFTDRPGLSSTESPNIRLSLENERLRRELEIARRQASERLRRIEALEAELSSKRPIDQEDNVYFELAMEQMKDNLKQSTKRTLDAESTVSSLKMQINSLMEDISMLRLENKELRMAVGLEGGNCKNTTLDRTISIVANDLRNAASSAETSLRQLMSGVGNLRVLASALENMDRIEDRTKDFLPDFEEDNAAGPAL